MELLVIGIFCAILVGCLLAHIPVAVAILLGLVVFLIYGKRKGFSAKELVDMCLVGVKKSKDILICFAFIGALTSLWRSSACIATIVCYASRFIHPAVFIFLTFVLCAVVSVLTGTSFGTVATIGVICMSIAVSMNISVFWVGGAVLSGIFWGDRCSPVSTCALLVATVTETDIYRNIKNMVRTAIVPTIIVSVIYLVVGFMMQGQESTMDVTALFYQEFHISWICLLPLVAILVMAFAHVDIKLTMAVSAVIAGVITIVLQGDHLGHVLVMSVLGYEAHLPELKEIMSGGGMISFLSTTVIVCVASCYSGIFEKTGLLNFLQAKIEWLAEKITVFGVTALISLPIAAIACNQTLSIMLVNQLTSRLPGSKELKALNLSDSVVLLCVLIPWCIAGQVPLDTIGAPHKCILAACFIYVLPLWQLVGRKRLK